MTQKLYELTSLVTPDFSEVEAQEFAKKLEEGFEDCKIIKSESPKKTGLCYPIRKQTAAFLTSVIFEAEASTAEKIKKDLEKNEKVLRFLLIHRKSIQETPIYVPKEKLAEATSELTKPEEMAAEPSQTEPIKPATAAIVEKKPEKKPRKKKIEIESEEIKDDLQQIGEDLDKILDQ